jgi:Condensation domain
MHTYEALSDGLFLGHGSAFAPPIKRPSPPTLHPLTPNQRELLSLITAGNEPGYVSLRLPIPKHISPSIDLIQHAWRAVASHNSALRARFVRWSGDWKLRIPREIANIEFHGGNDNPPDHEQPATLVVRLTSEGLSAFIRIHRALIDDHSLPLICKDFSSFLNGVALDRRSEFEDFIDRTVDRDANAAKLYWRTQAMDAALAPIHGISIEPSPLSKFISAQLPKEETTKLLDFATSCHESIQTVLYAAWATTLASHTESGSSSVTFAVTGRNTLNDYDFVGLGDQVYPLVVRTDGGQPIKDMIKDVAVSNATAARHAFIGYKSILEQFVEPEGPTFFTIRVNHDGSPLEVSTKQSVAQFLTSIACAPLLQPLLPRGRSGYLGSNRGAHSS